MFPFAACWHTEKHTQQGIAHDDVFGIRPDGHNGFRHQRQVRLVGPLNQHHLIELTDGAAGQGHHVWSRS